MRELLALLAILVPGLIFASPTVPDNTKPLQNFWAKGYQAQWISQTQPSPTTDGEKNEYFEVKPGDEVEVIAKFKNTGTETWYNAPEDRQVCVSIYKDPYVQNSWSWKGGVGESEFQDSSWMSKYRIGCVQEASVEPGEIGTFDLKFKIPEDAPFSGTENSEEEHYREDITLSAGPYWVNSVKETADLVGAAHVWVSFFIRPKGYFIKENAVYFNRELIKGADSQTFVDLGDIYGKDKNNVYLWGKAIDRAVEGYSTGPMDSTTFKRLRSLYSIDAHSAFWAGTKLIGSDTASFQVLSDDYAMDKNYVYFAQKRVSGVDQDSFKTFPESRFAADKISLYYWGERIPQGDPTSFRILNYYYAVDKNVAYLHGKKFPVADPTSFHALNFYYAADKDSVYYYKTKLPGIDISTFKVLSFNYSLDSKSGYYDGNIINGSDPNTFQVFDDNYALDKNNAYIDGFPIKSVDTATFRGLSRFFAVDKYSAYLVSTPLIGSDPTTFHVLNDTYAADKNFIYCHGCGESFKIEGDAGTFRVLDTNYGVDKNNAYYNGVKIQGSDVKSFRVTYAGSAIDSTGEYSGDMRIKNVQGTPIPSTTPTN